MLSVYSINHATRVLYLNFSVSFNTRAGFGSILNFIQINTLICEKMDTVVFDFS